MLDAVRLENCAVWNMDRVEEHEHAVKNPRLNETDRAYHERAAERHDMQAFRLFRKAHEMRTLGGLVAA